MSDAQDPSPLTDRVTRGLLGRVAKYWWVELVIGALWVVISLVILKFNHALSGCSFL
jgi:hypothetical protein